MPRIPFHFHAHAQAVGGFFSPSFANEVMNDYATFLAALVALLVGLAVGKAWERYKLQDGRWLDRRTPRVDRVAA